MDLNIQQELGRLSEGGAYLYKNMTRDASQSFKLRHAWPRGLSAHMILEKEIKAIHSAGPKVFVCVFDPSMLSQEEGAMYVRKMICHAAKQGNVTTLKEINLHCGLHREESQMAMMLACRHGHLTVVEYLVNERRVPADMTPDGFSALMVASKSGHMEIVKYLTDRNACIHDLFEHETATTLAANLEHYDVVEYLVGLGADSSFACSALNCTQKKCTTEPELRQALRNGLKYTETDIGECFEYENKHADRGGGGNLLKKKKGGNTKFKKGQKNIGQKRDRPPERSRGNKRQKGGDSENDSDEDYEDDGGDEGWFEE